MSQHVYCERCLDVIEEYEELVIVNGKPYHYHCYEKELSEQKKKSIIEIINNMESRGVVWE